MMIKNEINERQVFYDRLLVAMAAECYSEMIGESNPEYEIFFRTLRVLQK